MIENIRCHSQTGLATFLPILSFSCSGVQQEIGIKDYRLSPCRYIQNHYLPQNKV